MKISKLIILLIIIIGGATMAWQIMQIEAPKPSSHDHGHASHDSDGHSEEHGDHDNHEDEHDHQHATNESQHSDDDLDMSNMQMEDDHRHDEEQKHGEHDGHDDHDKEHSHGEHGEHEETYAEITRINPDSAKNAGIVIAMAKGREIQPKRLFPGEIAFNRNRVAHVVPRLSGVVVSVLKNEGDVVKKGEVLAAIDSRELASLKGSYMANKKRLELAKITYQREEKLWKERKSAEQEFLNAKQVLREVEIELEVSAQQLRAIGFSEKLLAKISQEKSPPTRLFIYAPQDGTVVNKHITLGESIGENDNIYTIADLTKLWGKITIYADDISNIRKGQKVFVSSDALNIETEGDIDFIASQINEKSQSVAARVNIPNPKGKWRPGLFVNVEVIYDHTHAKVAVPRSAIQTLEEEQVIFIVDHNNYKAVPVELGLADKKWVEVLSGVSAGQQYVAENSYLIKADIGKASATHDH